MYSFYILSKKWLSKVAYKLYKFPSINLFSNKIYIIYSDHDNDSDVSDQIIISIRVFLNKLLKLFHVFVGILVYIFFCTYLAFLYSKLI